MNNQICNTEESIEHTQIGFGSHDIKNLLPIKANSPWKIDFSSMFKKVFIENKIDNNYDMLTFLENKDGTFILSSCRKNSPGLNWNFLKNNNMKIKIINHDYHIIYGTLFTNIYSQSYCSDNAKNFYVLFNVGGDTKLDEYSSFILDGITWVYYCIDVEQSRLENRSYYDIIRGSLINFCGSFEK